MNKRVMVILIIGFALTAAALAIIIGYMNISAKENDAISNSDINYRISMTENYYTENYYIEENILIDELFSLNIPQSEIIADRAEIGFNPLINLPSNPPLRYSILPEYPRPGETVTIGVNKNEVEAILSVNDRQLIKTNFFTVPAENNRPEFRAAVFTIPSTVEPGRAVISLVNEWGSTYEIPITIAPREFRSETLYLTPSMSSLVSDPNPQRDIEANQLWTILTTTGNQVYHTGRFILPVTSTRRTSIYGTRRVSQYPDGRRSTSIHAGVDFGIPTGTEVYACGRGRVVLSRNRIISGYSVVLEHAPGVYSLYYHLDRVIAREGTIVEAGAVIGLSGSTGFSTGPHLHWEVRVNNENADPDAFVSRALIDKDAIISRIYY